MSREWAGEIPRPSQQQRERHESLFRRPMTSADERFYGLREAGYEGWIDQDGRPVSDSQHQADVEQRWARNEAAGLTYTTDRGWVHSEEAQR